MDERGSGSGSPSFFPSACGTSRRREISGPSPTLPPVVPFASHTCPAGDERAPVRPFAALWPLVACVSLSERRNRDGCAPEAVGGWRSSAGLLSANVSRSAGGLDRACEREGAIGECSCSLSSSLFSLLSFFSLPLQSLSLSLSQISRISLRPFAFVFFFNCAAVCHTDGRAVLTDACFFFSSPFPLSRAPLQAGAPQRQKVSDGRRRRRRSRRAFSSGAAQRALA